MKIPFKKLAHTILLIGVTAKALKWVKNHVVNTRVRKLLMLLVILSSIFYFRTAIWNTLSYAAMLVIPHVYSPGQVISSSDMNEVNAAIEQAMNHIQGEQIVVGSIPANRLMALSIDHSMLDSECVQRDNLYSNVVFTDGGLAQRTAGESETGSLYVKVDDETIEKSGSPAALRIKATVADDGLTTTTGNKLRSAVDNSTIGLKGTTPNKELYVKDDGITAAQIKDGEVGDAELDGNISPNQMDFETTSILQFGTGQQICSNTPALTTWNDQSVAAYLDADTVYPCMILLSVVCSKAGVAGALAQIKPDYNVDPPSTTPNSAAVTATGANGVSAYSMCVAKVYEASKSIKYRVVPGGTSVWIYYLGRINSQPK